MNGEPVGGKKCGNRWRDQLWSIRYLHKFQWEDLTGYKFMREMARKQKLKAELENVTAQNQFYLEQVAKKHEHRRPKASEKKDADDETEPNPKPKADEAKNEGKRKKSKLS